MRIFMLVQHPEARGPVPKHTAYLVDALRSLGCEVVTHPWGQRGPGERLFDKLLERARDVLSVQRALRHETFDIAVVKTSHDWRTLVRDIPAALVIRRRVRPVVLQLHGSHASTLLERGNRAFKAATTVLVRLVDGILVLSTEEDRQWRTSYPRLRVFAVKNPYVPAFSTAPDGRVEARPEERRLLFVGRLIEAKGVFDLVNALPDVLEHEACRLVIVGEGVGEQELRGLIHRLALEDRITLQGHLHGKPLRDQYAEATIFVLPSWDEGFPTVLAEAMDAGLPIVTTRIRGAADHLQPGENALFVAPKDVPALASAIRTLLRDGDLRVRMSDANRRRVGMFEPGAVAAEYLAALRKIVADVALS